ncbi:hypothetical protein V8V91_23915 [Algoriphagus halophilus]
MAGYAVFVQDGFDLGTKVYFLGFSKEKKSHYSQDDRCSKK